MEEVPGARGGNVVVGEATAPLETIFEAIDPQTMVQHPIRLVCQGTARLDGVPSAKDYIVTDSRRPRSRIWFQK